jgi:uncharacterized protein YqeY
MKSGEKHKVETLRGLQSDLKYRRIEIGADLSEADIVGVLRHAAKKRREAIEQFSKGGRKDLADKESAELALISAYLPADMADADLDNLIRDAIAQSGATSVQDLGKVMSAVMPKVQGGADGKRVNARVRELLSK